MRALGVTECDGVKLGPVPTPPTFYGAAERATFTPGPDRDARVIASRRAHVRTALASTGLQPSDDMIDRLAGIPS